MKFKAHIKAVLATAMLTGMAGGLAACQPRQIEPDPWTAETVDLNVRASHREVLAGEIVTFTASTRDTFGRDARVEWDAAGGELTMDENGRIARVQFDRPGTYVVTARLYINDELRRTDTTQIRVRPVNGPTEPRESRWR